MAGKIICLIGSLILVVDCAILINRDGVETRIKRSPHCEYCEGHYRSYPPHFHTHNWSGFSRNADGTPQEVFSGAAAAAETGEQSAGESQAFSVASSGVDGGNVGGGYHGKGNIGGFDSSRSQPINNKPSGYEQPQVGSSSKKESWTELHNAGSSGTNSQAGSSSARGDVGDQQQIQYGGSNHLKTHPVGDYQGEFGGHSSDNEYQKNSGSLSYGRSSTDIPQQQKEFGASRGQDNYSSRLHGSENANNGGGGRFGFGTSSANSQANGFEATGGRTNAGNRGVEARGSRSNGGNFGRPQSDNYNNNGGFESSYSNSNKGAGGFGSGSGGAGGYGLTKSRGTDGFESSSGYNNAGSGGYESSRYSKNGGDRGFGSDSGHFGRYDSSRGNSNGGSTGFGIDKGNSNGQFAKHVPSNSIGDAAGSSYSGPIEASGSFSDENKGHKASSNGNTKGSELTSASSNTAGALESGSSSYDSQSSLSGALNLASQGLHASQGLKASQKASGCATCGEKGSLAYSNAQSHSGSAVALSIGG